MWGARTTTRPLQRGEALRKATIQIEAIGLTCPECEEPMENPTNGSHLWLPEDLEPTEERTWVFHSACGEQVEVPLRPFERR